MSPLPPDIAKIRDELAHTTWPDNRERASVFKDGFMAAAEIFLKRERDSQNVFFDEIQWMEFNKLKSELEQERQRNEKLVEVLQKVSGKMANDHTWNDRVGMLLYIKKALTANAQAPREQG